MIVLNITIIYDNKNNAFNCVQLLLHNLKINVDLEVTEFYLSGKHGTLKKLSYIENFNSHSPDMDTFKKIITSLKKSDLFIIASQISNCDISIGMKNFFYNLSQYFIDAKIKSLIHNKIGIVVSTTAGAGLFYNTNLLKKNLNLLGMNYIFKFHETLYETNWNDINLKTKMKINKNAFNITYKILNLYNNLHSVGSQFFNKKICMPNIHLIPSAKNNIIDVSCLEKQDHYLHKHM
jgi:multimeric flavodoxin WrbA